MASKINLNVCIVVICIYIYFFCPFKKNCINAKEIKNTYNYLNFEFFNMNCKGKFISVFIYMNALNA